MTFRQHNVLRGLGLAILAVSTFSMTNLLTRKPRATAHSTTPNTISQPDVLPDIAALRATNRRDFIRYRDIIDVRQVADLGQLGLLVDVECWHGSKIMPRIGEAERAFRLRVCVYSPDDPDRQAAPIKVWESDAVEMVEGLYEERVPVSIPLDPSANPYPVTIELVSAQPMMHKPLGRQEVSFVPTGYCGTSRLVTIR